MDNRSQSIQTFSYKKTNKDEPDWYVCSVKLSNSPIGSINPLKLNASAGTSIYLEEALTRSVGEAIERYSSSNFFMSETPHLQTVDETKQFVRCADCENAPVSFKKSGITEKIEHTKVFRLADQSTDYLPYETVHLGYLKKDTKALFSSPISTGCSFFHTKETAIFKGIMEVIERDAIMRWWYLNFPDTRVIRTDDIFSFDIQERIKRIKSKNMEVYLFEISAYKKFPVVLCLLKGNSFPYACFGASCNTDIKKQLRNLWMKPCLYERWQNGPEKSKYKYPEFQLDHSTDRSHGVICQLERCSCYTKNYKSGKRRRSFYPRLSGKNRYNDF